MSTRKSVSIVFALTLIGSMLASCAGATPTAAPTQGTAPTQAAAATASGAGAITITFWNSFTGSDADTLKSIVNDFNTQNAGKIQIEMDIMSADVFNQKVPPAIATKTGPNLITLDVGSVLAYEKQKSIEDLSDFFSASGANKSDFLDAALKLGFDDNAQYGIPMQLFDSTNMFWNKDLFKAAGLDPNSPPKTLDELAADAVKLTDPSKNQFGFGMFASAAPQWYAVFIKGNGGDVVDPATNKSVLNSPANLATFNSLHTLAYTNGVTPKSTGGVAMDNLMQSGKLGIYFNGPWAIPGLQSHNINFGIAQVPAGSAGTFGILDGTLFAVPSGTDAAHKAAVYEFLKYWNSTPIGKKWSLSDGMPPYLNSVINDPAIQSNATISLLAKNASGAAPWLGGLPSAGDINANVLFPLMEQLQNNVDVTATVTKASAQLDTILQGQQ